MPQSPHDNSDAVVTFAVTCNGSPMADTVNVLRIQVRRAIGQVASAVIELLDGDMPDGVWEQADGSSWLPGVEIDIQAGYGSQNQTVFKGRVVRLSSRIGADNVSRLLVDCRDDAVSMTLNRVNAIHADSTDSDVITKLAGAHGLSCSADATSLQHRELVQYLCSDWDFVLARAEANGLLVLTDDGTLKVQAPVTSGSAALSVTWGVDLIDFHADMDARLQPGPVSSAAWDPATQAVVEGSQASPTTLNAQGNLTAATLNSALPQRGTRRLQTGGVVKQDELTAWAKAEQQRAGLARLRGTLRFQGSALAKPNSLLKLAGVGARFSGDVFIGRVEHEIAHGNWVTEVGFGLDPDWFCARPDVSSPPNGARLPACSGLQVGVVVKLDQDPDGAKRIQIKLPVLGVQGTETVWARLLQPYASNAFGFFFWPEVNDEVLVGFFDQDPSQPVVLGSLYSSKHTPAVEPTAENNTKSVVTRSKLKLEFDEKKKSITLSTPGGNQALLDDDGKQIQLKDQHGNTVTLNSSGIQIDSIKDIKITAKAGITLDAVNAIGLTAKADVSAKGMNVSCEGQIGFTGKGSATAELSASGQTTVKGALVMIN